MTKPKNVRCETCVFWTQPLSEHVGNEAACHLTPHAVPTDRLDFCGEWRDTWPPTRDIVYLGKKRTTGEDNMSEQIDKLKERITNARKVVGTDRAMQMNPSDIVLLADHVVIMEALVELLERDDTDPTPDKLPTEKCSVCGKSATGGAWSVSRRRHIGFHCQDCWSKVNEEISKDHRLNLPELEAFLDHNSKRLDALEKK